MTKGNITNQDLYLLYKKNKALVKQLELANEDIVIVEGVCDRIEDRYNRQLEIRNDLNDTIAILSERVKESDNLRGILRTVYDAWNFDNDLSDEEEKEVERLLK